MSCHQIPGVRPLFFAGTPDGLPPPSAGLSPIAARPGGIGGASVGAGGGAGVHPTKKPTKTIPQNQLFCDIENLKLDMLKLFISYSFV